MLGENRNRREKTGWQTATGSGQQGFHPVSGAEQVLVTRGWAAGLSSKKEGAVRCWEGQRWAERTASAGRWDGMRFAGEGEGHGKAGEARRPQQAESWPESHGDLG